MFIRFPELAAFQWGFKAKHFSEPVDGHEGSWTYHFAQITDLLPPYAWWLVLPALVWLAFRAARWEHRVMLLALPLAVHLFFALAATKMVSYTMVLLPLYLIAVACVLHAVVDLLVKERWRVGVGIFAAALLAVLGLDLDRTQFRHSSYQGEQEAQDPWRERVRALAFEETLVGLMHGPGPFALFNVPSQRGQEIMFRFGVEAIDIIPSQAEVDRLRAKGYSVVIFQDTHPMDEMPQGVHVVTDAELVYPRIQRD
jgi:4-amino-4-deoxy-L-arabinose transferase